MGQISFGQAITSFIVANLGTLLIHLVIMIRTGATNEKRLENLECDMKKYKEKTQDMAEQMAALTGRAQGIRYRRGEEGNG